MAEPKPQRRLLTTLHWAYNHHLGSSSTSAHRNLFRLIFSIHDADWITWYTCKQSSTYDPKKYPVFQGSNGWGWSPGRSQWTEAENFFPSKPRRVDEFDGHLTFPLARIQIQRIRFPKLLDSLGQWLAVGMTLFLDRPENFDWYISTVSGAEVPKEFQWGWVEQLKTESLFDGMRLGISRFLPKQPAPQGNPTKPPRR
jgi:hypothetical protein